MENMIETNDKNQKMSRLKRLGFIGLSLICALLITGLLLGLAAVKVVKPAQAKSNQAPTAIDLSINKSDTGDFTAGTYGKYVVTIKNESEAISTAGRITVTDNIPSPLEFEEASGTGWIITPTGNSFTGTYDFASLAASETLPVIDITVTVPAASSVVVTNTATLEIPGDIITTTNNTANDCTNVNPIDLRVSKSVNSPNPLDGAVVIFNIVVTNDGPITATNVKLTDILPGKITYSSYSTSSSPSGQLYNSTTGLWTIGTLPDNASATLTLTGRINSGSGPIIISNLASGLTSNEPDSNSSNNSDTEDINVGVSPDLQISKTDNQSSVTPGEQFTYKISITNTGSAPAAGIVITDVLPANLSYVSSTLGGHTTPVTNTHVWTVATPLAVDGVISFDLVVKAAASLSSVANLNNVVSVSTTTPEGNTTNNTANDNDSVFAVDLEVSKSYEPAVTLEGSLITFTVEVTNNGPITATNVLLTDQIPIGMTNISRVIPSGTNYNIATGVWSIGTMAEGVSKTLQLIGRINLGTDGDTIKNTASGLTSDNVDNDLTNNSDSVSFVVGGAPDLQIHKTDEQSAISPNDEFTYTIYITNTGSEDATGIVITDVLPAYINYITDTLRTLGITFTYPTARTYRWDYPFDIEAGDTITFELGVKAASAMTGLTQVNNVEVSTTTSEGNTSNNSASDTDNISYTPSVSFSKSASPTEQKLNGYITFYIYVTNNSNVAISNVVVKDTFSTSYLDIASVSTTKGSASYSSSTNVATISIGTLNASNSATITISCKVVNASTAATSLTNYAYLTYSYGGTSLSKTASAGYRISSSSSSLPGTGGAAVLWIAPQSPGMTGGVVMAIVCSVLLFGLGIGLLFFGRRLKTQQSEWAEWCIKMGPVMMVVAVGFAVVAWGLSGFSNQPAITQALEPTQVVAINEQQITDLKPIDIPLTEDELEFLPDYPAPTPSFVPTLENTETPVDKTAPVRILIPDLAVDAVIKYVPYENSTWLISGLKQEIAWLGETSWPGLGSNTGLAGHVTLNSGENGPFRYLDQLNKGSVITLFTEKNIYTYKVRDSKIVDSTDTSVLDPTTQPSLTLITCTNWDKEQRSYVKRYIVFADLDTTVPISVNVTGN